MSREGQSRKQKEQILSGVNKLLCERSNKVTNVVGIQRIAGEVVMCSRASKTLYPQKNLAFYCKWHLKTEQTREMTGSD